VENARFSPIYPLTSAAASITLNITDRKNMRALVLFLMATGSGWSQSAWLKSPADGLIGGGERETFTLRGAYLSGSSVRPNITLVCRGGKLVSSAFNTDLLARQHFPSRTNAPPDRLRVSISIGEKKHEVKAWKATDGNWSFYTDTRFVKDLVSANHVDVGFTRSRGMTAEFEPSAVDAQSVRNACGLR